MKKLSLFLSLLSLTFILFAFSACGAGDVGSDEYMAKKAASENAALTGQTQTDPAEKEPEWDPTFDGLIECFKWHGYIDVNTKFNTAADVVGANVGYRFTSNACASGPFNLELYYYDPQNPLGNSQEFINKIKESGHFTLLDNDIQSVVSNNGKYMMVYSSTSTKPEDLEKKQEIYDVLINFN
ncbi:MAG: hypothetical protein Q4B14_00620 [Clostridia bacterium]|nr:hypothetical protein [Clostridia bacterium]